MEIKKERKLFFLKKSISALVLELKNSSLETNEFEVVVQILKNRGLDVETILNSLETEHVSSDEIIEKAEKSSIFPQINLSCYGTNPVRDGSRAAGDNDFSDCKCKD